MWSSLATKDVVLLIVGAFLGVFLDRIAGAVWDKRLQLWWSSRRTRTRGKRALRKQQIAGEFVVIGSAREHCYVYQYSVAGFDGSRLATRIVDEQSVSDRLSSLPDALRPVHVSEVEARVQRTRDRLEGDQNAWNEKKYGLNQVHLRHDPDTEAPALGLDFHSSDYATFQVITKAWQEHVQGIEIQDLLTPSLVRTVLPGMSHSFGINATVVTADNQLLLVDRSKYTRDARQKMHISVNEGMRVDDHDDQYRPDPYQTLRRGILEELGFDPGQHGVFHTLMCDASRYQWALLGHVDLRGTNLTTVDIRAARGLGVARDAWESERIWPEPFTPERVVKLLKDQDHWIAHGWLNLALSAMFAFPDDENLHRKLFALLIPRKST